MPFISQLDVINEMLSSLGESPINVIEEDHPLIAAGVRMLRVANLREQSKSWWFNKERVTLEPDAASGFIYTPADAIRVDPCDQTLNYVQRGRRLYQAYGNSTNRYKFTAPVTCDLVVLIPFEDLPATAATFVSYSAQRDFQKAYDADRMKVEQLAKDYQMALMTLNAEHIRNVGANLLERASGAYTYNMIAPGALGRYSNR